MKLKNPLKLALGVLLALAALSTNSARAGETNAVTKPYPLTKCVVCDANLGEAGKPYTFAQEGQEIKLCGKSCLTGFKNESAKHLKKIQDAQKSETP